MPKSNRKQYWKINLNEFECRLQTKTRQTNQSSRQAFAFFTFMSNDQKHWAALFQIFFTSLSVQTNQFQFFFVQLPLNVCAQKRALFFSLFLVSTIVDLCLNVMQVSQCKILYSFLVLSTTNALAYFTFCYCYFYFCYPVMYRKSEKNREREKKNARNFSHVFVICFTTIQRANEGFGISVTLN